MNTPDALTPSPRAIVGRARGSAATLLAAGVSAVVLAGCAGPHGHRADTASAGAHGLQTLRSPHTQAQTLARLEAQLTQRQLTVAARVDHAAAAQRVGQALAPTVVVIFGNPQAGTPLMQCAQTAGIDLPMKALVWTDAGGQVWLGWNEPAWIAHRHGARDCPAAVRLGQALAGLAAAVVAP
ncbi:DUF302 domain-containing protein [Rubrivivax albus]|uniref:DUF302 domain-containing protein n=1 Tax=Rubrivivax albus TaxID=2499835 RepID=A0A3S2TKX4_9BURK|nr:DUF302 domain-containing protein [Rubrivivax albus]RVT49602.1 DUF302 domain-containing protein [Rubrivivax albus]